MINLTNQEIKDLLWEEYTRKNDNIDEGFEIKVVNRKTTDIDLEKAYTREDIVIHDLINNKYYKANLMNNEYHKNDASKTVWKEVFPKTIETVIYE